MTKTGNENPKKRLARLLKTFFKFSFTGLKKRRRIIAVTKSGPAGTLRRVAMANIKPAAKYLVGDKFCL